MAADLRFVAHAAERHAHELAAGRLGDRLAERGLADAGRADEAEDRAGQLVGALLHGEIFDDALLDLVEAEVVGVEERLRGRQVLLDLRLLLPRNRQQPVEVVAHHRRLGRHRRHLPQLLQLAERLVARFLGQLGLLDAVLELGHFVRALFVAELLLDRLHLLVEIVLALRLLHLALDARADALLDLQHRDFALHQGEALLEALGDRMDLEDRLLVGELDREMRGDRVGELAVVVDLRDRGDHFGRDLLVELDVVLELRDDRARQRLGLDRIDRVVGDRLGLGLIIALGRQIGAHVRARLALDQHLDGAVGQLEQLQNLGERAGGEDRVGRRIVVGGVHLRRQQDRLVRLHHLLEGANRLLAADEQRHDHVREHDDVAQRQDGIDVEGAGRGSLAGAGHSRSCFSWPGRGGGRLGLEKTPTGRRAPAPTVRAPDHAAYTLTQDAIPAPTLRRHGACNKERCTNRLTRRWRLGGPVSSGGRGESPPAPQVRAVSRPSRRARRRCRAAAPCPRPPRARSRPARRRRGQADRTWCRAGFLP